MLDLWCRDNGRPAAGEHLHIRWGVGSICGSAAGYDNRRIH